MWKSKSGIQSAKLCNFTKQRLNYLKMYYFFHPIDFEPNAQLFLDTEEVHHLIRVLRYSKGDSVYILNGKGAKATGILIDVQKKGVVIEIEKIIIEPKEGPFITICQSVLKSRDRMEWMVEKLTEGGIAEINFYFTERSEKKGFNIDRIEKIAISALKQSGNLYLPKINLYPNLKDMIVNLSSESQKLIAYTPENKQNNIANLYKYRSDVAVLIGPEGDFTDSEIDFVKLHQFSSVSLGSHRFRAETAAIVAQYMIQGLNLKD